MLICVLVIPRSLLQVSISSASLRWIWSADCRVAHMYLVVVSMDLPRVVERCPVLGIASDRWLTPPLSPDIP